MFQCDRNPPAAPPTHIFVVPIHRLVEIFNRIESFVGANPELPRFLFAHPPPPTLTTPKNPTAAQVIGRVVIDTRHPTALPHYLCDVKKWPEISRQTLVFWAQSATPAPPSGTR